MCTLILLVCSFICAVCIIKMERINMCSLFVHCTANAILSLQFLQRLQRACMYNSIVHVRYDCWLHHRRQLSVPSLYLEFRSNNDGLPQSIGAQRHTCACVCTCQRHIQSNSCDVSYFGAMADARKQTTDRRMHIKRTRQADGQCTDRKVQYVQPAVAKTLPLLIWVD